MHKRKVSIFFDYQLFKYSFCLLLKRTSLYVSCCFYFLLIISLTAIVPWLTEASPILIVSNPIMALFFVFLVSVVASCIAVEVFRSSIDDGSEILIASKPISRIEIVIVKLVIYLVTITIVALLSSLISSISFAVEESYWKDNLQIVIGMFIGTIICGIFFGSVATILSIYIKKIASIMITISLAIMIMAYSMLSIFVVVNPIKALKGMSNVIKPTSIVNYYNKPDKNNRQNYMTLVQGVVPSSPNLKPENIWKEAVESSNYKIANYFDFGSQLGGIFSFNAPPKDLQEALYNLSTFNAPIDFNFIDYDLMDDNKQFGFFLTMPYLQMDWSKIPSTSEIFNYYQEINQTLDFYNQKRILAKITAVDNTRSSISNSNRNWRVDFQHKFGEFENFAISSQAWDDAWNKKIVIDNRETTIKEIVNRRKKDEFYYYESSKEWVEKSKIDPLIPYPDWLPSYLSTDKDKEEYLINRSNLSSVKNATDIFLEEYARYFKLNQENKEEFLIELNKITLSGYYKLVETFSKDPVNNKEYNIFNIFDLTTDIEKDVSIKTIFQNFDSSIIEKNDLASKIVQYVKEEYYKYFQKELDGDTYFYQLIEFVENVDYFKEVLIRKSSTRNEFRSILGLMGMQFPEKLNKNQFVFNKFFNVSVQQNNVYVHIYPKGFTNLATSKTPSFRYYVGDNPQGYLQTNTIDEYLEWSKQDLVFNYNPAISLMIADSNPNFRMVEAYSTLNEHIFIPIWISISIVVFAISSTLYYRRDFA